MILQTILGLLSILLFVYYLWLFAHTRPAFFPPGPPRLPLWGSYWFLLKEHYTHPHIAIEKLAKRYNTDLLGFYLGSTPAIVPISHDLCKEVLTRDEFTGRNDTIITRLRGLGGPRGIFFLDGPTWRFHRRFTLRNLRDFGFGRRSERVESFVTDEIKACLDLLTKNPKKEDKGVIVEKGVALLPDLVYAPMLNSILTIISSSTHENSILRDIGRAALRFQRSGDVTGGAISITPWLRYIAPKFFGYTDAKESNEFLINFSKEVIEEHRKTFSHDSYRDLIDVYLREMEFLMQEPEINESFSEEQLVLTFLDYMFPAAIAIGHTMSFMLAHLANHPRVQREIQEEIDRVVGRNRFPTLDDRKSMVYTEASIRETVRFVPLNPLGIPRRCVQDTVLRGYVIPKDTIVLAGVWTAHKDAKVFGDRVDEFLPERFLDERGNLKKKDPTFGFGAGKRLCAGETFARHNMFLMVTGILQSFTLQSANGKKVDMENLIPGANLSIPNNLIKFLPRDN